MNRTFLFCLCALLSALLCSCEEPVRPGEVAMVNGVPITLKQVQAAHDTLVPGGDNPSRSLEEVRSEYGDVLGELIVQELVMQELERKGQEVTEQELEKQEAVIRSDFPPEEFERMLLEESIDEDLWRDTLRRQLGMEKFFRRVLRRELSVSPEEVDEYYRAHIDEFKLPERLHFLQVSGLAKGQIADACNMFIKNADASAVQTAYPGLSLREVRMRVDRLAPQQISGLSGLKKMHASALLELNGEFFCMVLLDREAPRTLSRDETFVRIEEIIMEDKVQRAFDSWLAGRMAKSKIKVSKHLLPENLQ